MVAEISFIITGAQFGFNYKTRLNLATPLQLVVHAASAYFSHRELAIYVTRVQKAGGSRHALPFGQPNFVRPFTDLAGGMINFTVDFIFGALMGALGGFFGIGGGLVAIPLMTLVLGLSQTMAQGTALVMMVPNVALALWRYQQRSPIRWSLALPLSIMGFITAGIGAQAAVHIHPLYIRMGFAVLMLGLAALTLLRNRIPHRDSKPKAQPSPHRLGALGSGCGVLGGFFGVGASVVAVPVLTGVFGLSQLAAQGMALTLALPSTMITLATYCWNDHVDWPMGLAMALGGLLSVGWGVKWAYRVHERHLRILFAVFLVASATMLLIKG